MFFVYGRGFICSILPWSYICYLGSPTIRRIRRKNLYNIVILGTEFVTPFVLTRDQTKRRHVLVLKMCLTQRSKRQCCTLAQTLLYK